jgi:nucleoside triphosphatase
MVETQKSSAETKAKAANGKNGHVGKESKLRGGQMFPEPTVGGLIVNEEGKLLLAKSHKWNGKYTLPGGHIELGETMEQAVKREVKEETGLDVEVVQFLLHQEAIYSNEFYKEKHYIFFDFYCKTLGRPVVKLDKDELQDHIWVYPGAAFSLDLDSFTLRTIDKFLSRR